MAQQSEHLPPTNVGPGSIPMLSIICGWSSLLVLVLAPRGSSLGTPVVPSPQKPRFPNSNSIWIIMSSTLSCANSGLGACGSTPCVIDTN